MLVERPKAFIPTEDQGYLIAAIQTPDGTGEGGHCPRSPRRVGKIAQDLEAVSRRARARRLQRLELDQPDQLGHGVRRPRRSGRSATSPSCEPTRSPTSSRQQISAEVRGAVVLVLQPPPIRGLSQTGGFEFMIEDREGRGVEALAKVTDRFPRRHARSRTTGPCIPSWGLFTPFSAQVPQLRFELDRVKAERLDVAVSDVFTVLQTNLGGFYVNDFNLYGKVWKVIIQAEGKRPAPSPTTSPTSTCSTGRRTRFP